MKNNTSVPFKVATVGHSGQSGVHAQNHVEADFSTKIGTATVRTKMDRVFVLVKMKESGDVISILAQL